jgi:hypothetical protein
VSACKWSPFTSSFHFAFLAITDYYLHPAALLFCVFKKEVRGELEHYADYGGITSITSLQDQLQIFPAINLNVSPKWEINFGVGIGPTAATDHWIVKGILGRHFDWPARNK